MNFPTTYNPNVYNNLYIMFLQRFSSGELSKFTYIDYKNNLIHMTSWFNNITIYELFQVFEENRMGIFQVLLTYITTMFSMTRIELTTERRQLYDSLASNGANWNSIYKQKNYEYSNQDVIYFKKRRIIELR